MGFLSTKVANSLPKRKSCLIEANRLKYGLTEEQLAEIKLPAPCHLVQLYDVDKIKNPRLKLTTIEKINHLIKL